ncbi:putative G-protein coupled receptor Mth-like 10 [Formica fusca]
MCRKNLVFWYCTLFVLVVMSSKTQQNFTGNEEKNDHLTIRYEIDADSTTNYGDEMKTRLFDLYEKTTNNTQYEDVQYKSRIVSTSNDRENDDWKQFISIQEFYENIMEIKNTNLKRKFKNSRKDSNTSYIIPYESCINITCIQLCCPLGYRLNEDECILEKNKYIFPNVYEYINDSLKIMNKTVDELFSLVAPGNLCQDDDYFYLDDYHDVNYAFLANGSLYLSYYKIFVNSYCLAAVDKDKYKVAVCEDMFDQIEEMLDIRNPPYIPIYKKVYNYVYKHVYKYVHKYVNDQKIIRVNYYIVSIPFLVSIFVVYSILPELRNVHGFMLCNYSGALSVAYIIDFIPILIEANGIHPLVCITIDFFNNFFFLTSFFWLTIMSFDMWWTFRGFCSLQRNVRQQKKKQIVVLFDLCVEFIFYLRYYQCHYECYFGKTFSQKMLRVCWEGSVFVELLHDSKYLHH